jgi:hypothetical protein
MARLGKVLYWAGCGLAVILLLLSAASAIFGEGEARTFGIVLLAVLGVPVWRWREPAGMCSRADKSTMARLWKGTS